MDRPAGPHGPNPPATFWTLGEGLAWVAGLVLLLSSFMGWYSSTDAGITFSVLGWHTGTLGKIVFVIGLVVLVVLVMRAGGVELPPSISTGIVIAGLGAGASILVLIRVISIPNRLEPIGRGIGIWISLAAAGLLILAGLLQAADET